jgi:hypothetical protein
MCGECFVSGGEVQQQHCARPILLLKISERNASADLIIELTMGRTWPKFYSASHFFLRKVLGGMRVITIRWVDSYISLSFRNLAKTLDENLQPSRLTIPSFSILRVPSLYPFVYLCLFASLHLRLIGLKCFFIAGPSPFNYLDTFPLGK